MGTKSGVSALFPDGNLSRPGGGFDRGSSKHGNGRAPKMRVNLFGGLFVIAGGQAIPDDSWKKNKSKLFFAHVVTSFGKAVNREHIIQCLWPDMDHKRAVDNVYVTWCHLRQALGQVGSASDYVSSRNSMYRINPELVESDVYEFDVLARKLLFNNLNETSVMQHISRMEQIYTGELLSGMSCDPHLERLRKRYKDTYIDALTYASEKLLSICDYPGALWFARKALYLESHREDVYQVLMRAQMAAGQRIPAMDTFFMCKDYLDNELGISPSRKTIELYERLLNEE